MKKTELEVPYISLLVICKVLVLTLNTFTADDEYSLVNRDNLTQPIQIPLSKKQNNFVNFFLPFWNLDQTLDI